MYMSCINVYTVCTSILNKMLLKMQRISLASQKHVCLKNWPVPSLISTAGTGRMWDTTDWESMKTLTWYTFINKQKQLASGF